jgi:hypothetical protein
MTKRKVTVVVRRESDNKKVCSLRLSKEELSNVLIVATAAGMSIEEFFTSALKDTVNNLEKCTD